MKKIIKIILLIIFIVVIGYQLIKDNELEELNQAFFYHVIEAGFINGSK